MATTDKDLIEPQKIHAYCYCHQCQPRSQQGVALLTILLLVVAIVIVAGSMLARQKIMVREYEATKRQGQVKEAVLAGEAFVHEMIAQDSMANQTDSPQDVWAKPLPSVPTDNGTISVHISDEASRFNINNLYHDGKVDDTAVSYFKALLRSQKIDPAIANAALDWQDTDSDTTPEGGAEADYYQSLGQNLGLKQSIANQPFISVDELINIKGMDKEKLAKLKPLLTAVPYFLPMNVNTVNPVLLSIMPSVPANAQNNSQNPNQNHNQNASQPNNQLPTNLTLDMAALNHWASSRATAMPLDSVNKLWELPVFASMPANQRQQLAPLLDVQSRAFRVAITVTYDDKTSYFTSLLAKVDAPNASNTTNQANSPAPPKHVIAFQRQFLAMPPAT